MAGQKTDKQIDITAERQLSRFLGYLKSDYVRETSNMKMSKLLQPKKHLSKVLFKATFEVQKIDLCQGGVKILLALKMKH